MSRETIQPYRVTRPFQLLAAWLVALIVLDGGFLTAARAIERPDWITPFLVIAAVTNVPVFLISLFVLLTRFRAELQEDQFYSVHLERNNKVRELVRELDAALAGAGIDFSISTVARQLTDQPSQVGEQLSRLRMKLESELEALQTARSHMSSPEAVEARLELGKVSLAEQNWQRAITYLEQYRRDKPGDWEAALLSGVAYANSRGGRDADVAALKSYSDALALAPDHLDDDRRARLLSYRGAMLKRLGRLKEAEADLLLAKSLARVGSILNDTRYNLAGVYALKGDRECLMETIIELRDSPVYLRAIQAHLDDYFARFADDIEFRRAVRLTEDEVTIPDAHNPAPAPGGWRRR